ncbi:MAG: hypothetical protein ACAI35_24095 [Candidatus Methylacidiphilales bacterium]|nr:hypothetical protein [Candidatus Methylacidiphilales bacterium]
MTLFRQIQHWLERTYCAIELNLEHCLITPDRCRDLTRQSGGLAQAMEGDGRIFLQPTGNRLRMAIFYAPPLIDELERNDPRQSINERNIAPLITFIEEIVHGVHAALCFREGERDLAGEHFACAMEAQAKVDTFLVLMKLARSLCGAQVPDDARGWLRAQVFDDGHEHMSHPQLRMRYAMATAVASRFVDRLHGIPLEERPTELRRFRTLSWPAKAEMAALPA